MILYALVSVFSVAIELCIAKEFHYRDPSGEIKIGRLNSDFTSKLFIQIISQHFDHLWSLSAIKNLCKPNTTNYSICLKKTLEEAWPQIVKGIPQINLPPIDPFFLDYDKGIINSGGINGEVAVYNTTIIGFKNTRILAFKSYIHDGKYDLEADIFMPKLILDGGGSGIGTLGPIRMGGKGRYNATAENVRTAYYVTAHAENDTLVVDHVQIIPVIGRLKIHFMDYFEGNKELNNLLELFVNEFWPVLYRIFMPIASKIGGERMTNFYNFLLSKFSISQIFP